MKLSQGLGNGTQTGSMVGVAQITPADRWLLIFVRATVVFSSSCAILEPIRS